MLKAENRAENRIVIVGAGIGGLAAALALSAAGRRVTVLERHAHPGGKARNVETFAGPAPAGPTVMTMRSVFDGLFAAAGARLDDHVSIHREPLLARHFWEDGSTLDLTDDPAANEAAIAAFAGPREAVAFRRFAADARRLYEGFEAPMMEAAEPTFGALALHVLRHPSLIPAMTPHLTLAQALARRFADPRLRQLFGRYATYVGGAPGRSPALLSLIWESEARGVWRVQGGIAALAAAMARLAEAHGAEFRLGAHVEEIETERGAATGLRLAGGERIAARTILFNGDPAALRRGLLGPGARGAVMKAAVSPRSLSAFVWSFAATPSRPDLAHHNVFFGPDPAREFGPIEAGAMPEAPSLYVCAADRGGGTQSGPERFEIIMNGAPDEPGRAEERERCRDLTFGTLARFGLTFSPAPGPESLTTPQDFAALFPGSDGSLYGRSPHGAMAAFARPTARSRIPGLFLCGGGTHPGAGVPMAARSGLRAAEAILGGPFFDIHVGPDGYAWWYLDGISDDGARAVSVIGFIGSVFSPWYRWSGRRDPANHCCINVATYGPGGRFTMTDRGRAALRLSPRKFEVGPSSMHWDGKRLIVEIDEISTPHLTRLRGRIILTPSAITDVELPLTEDGAHVWRPFAPVAGIEVELDRPGWSWSGHGYLDANFGTRALEADFSHWCWGRFPTGAGGALAFYDAEMRDGSRFDAAFAFGADGSARAVEAPPPVRFARSLWAVKRETRADPGFRPRQVMSMLEAPFYTRAVVETEIGGERLTGVHEALDLDRFRGPWLMPMLAMRVPRRAGWTFRPGAETD